MSQLSRTALKAFFETGDMPTEAQFGDLIDSSPNIVDDGPSPAIIQSDVNSYISFDGSPVDFANGYSFPADTFVTAGDTAIVTAIGENGVDTDTRGITIGLDGTNSGLVEAAHISNYVAWDFLAMFAYQGGNSFFMYSRLIQSAVSSSPGPGQVISRHLTIAKDPTNALPLDYDVTLIGGTGSMIQNALQIVLQKA